MRSFNVQGRNVDLVDIRWIRWILNFSVQPTRPPLLWNCRVFLECIAQGLSLKAFDRLPGFKEESRPICNFFAQGHLMPVANWLQRLGLAVFEMSTDLLIEVWLMVICKHWWLLCTLDQRQADSPYDCHVRLKLLLNQESDLIWASIKLIHNKSL